jgi:RNA polymerase sigma-70 factor (ECF subfamily)
LALKAFALLSFDALETETRSTQPVTMSASDNQSEERGAAHFATTHWSVVLRAGHGESAETTAALGRLYHTYSYPLYAYVRRQGHDAETAEDLVQEVFLAMLDRNQLASVRPEKGRFRSYLLSAVNHLLANEWHKRRRQKRGGGQTPVALDALGAEERYRLEPVDDRAPDRLYERRWALALLDAVFARLRAEWEAAGKARVFESLRVFLSGDQDSPRYAAVGESLGWSEGATRVAVHRLRQQYRDLLREEIAQTVANPAEGEDELRHLLAVLRE